MGVFSAIFLACDWRSSAISLTWDFTSFEISGVVACDWRFSAFSLTWDFTSFEVSGVDILRSFYGSIPLHTVQVLRQISNFFGMLSIWTVDLFFCFFLSVFMNSYPLRIK